MSDEPVLLGFAEGIATLTFNRPDNLNAASAALMRSLERRLHDVIELPDLRCVILTGAGRAFCAGGDLIEFEAALQGGGTRLIDTLRTNQEIIQMVEDLPVPVIGAVNGAAVAGGLELLLCCDIVIAAEGAKLGDGHARYGIVPAGGASVRLGERIGPSRAAQLFYTAALIDTKTAEAWGLVNEVVAREKLMERAFDLAREISLASPQVNRHIKALTGPLARPERRAERILAELERFAEHIGGSDLQAGLAAFREKRLPDY
ncbi:enoyl-CoA hydratase/isomerase family protein [Mesorhizobium sp. CAU 1741]|uniref:enoyl-CoA hydratase/isomerase family protein n=1 Tax=Mesorhizobium sp. CAU 1741 TaxID=3140366 RepID=UPI00325B6609